MHVCGFVCGFVRVCMCACVYVCVRTIKENKILGVQIQYFQNTAFSYSIQVKPKKSFPLPGRALTGNSPIVSCEKECSGVRDEGRSVQVRETRALRGMTDICMFMTFTFS